MNSPANDRRAVGGDGSGLDQHPAVEVDGVLFRKDISQSPHAFVQTPNERFRAEVRVPEADDDGPICVGIGGEAEVQESAAGQIAQADHAVFARPAKRFQSF